MSERTELAKGFTDRDYRQALKDQKAAAIADAIRRRFRKRYLTPITGTTKHGFTMMAGACLTIAALESVRQFLTAQERQAILNDVLMREKMAAYSVLHELLETLPVSPDRLAVVRARLLMAESAAASGPAPGGA